MLALIMYPHFYQSIVYVPVPYHVRLGGVISTACFTGRPNREGVKASYAIHIVGVDLPEL